MKHINEHIKDNKYYKFLIALEKGADPNSPDKYGEYPVHAAAQSKNLGYMKLLMNAGANPNQTNAGGVSALQVAVEFGKFATITYLLSCGADPSYQSPGGRTVLSYSKDPSIEIVMILKRFKVVWTREDMIEIGNIMIHLNEYLFN